MPSGRPSKGLQAYKNDILRHLSEQWKHHEIITWLADNKDLVVERRTLLRYLKQWGIPPQLDRTEDIDELRQRIRIFFCRAGATDEEMVRWLRIEGFTISPSGLVRIRKELGYKRLETSQEARDHMDEVVRGLIYEEAGKNVIQGLGRGMLVEHFRKLGHPVIRYASYETLRTSILTYLRDRLFAQYRTLFPDAVDRRLRDLQRVRGEYVIPGPNLVWSVDGHDKLRDFGIEIYAGIDAYARYIPWCTTGISNRTAISVLRGYLDTISSPALNQQPRFVRSDRGGETVLMAHAHLTLQQANDPEITFRDCYMYGTSTANQRIESWWAQLTKISLGKWIDFFRTLRDSNLFSNDMLADRIAILIVYLPTIRTEVTQFVDKWNTHNIRRQSNRPKSMQGKPLALFYYPKEGIKNYGLGLDQPTLARLRRDVEDYSKSFPFVRSLYTKTKKSKYLNPCTKYISEYLRLCTRIEYTPLIILLYLCISSYEEKITDIATDPDEYLPPFTLKWCNTFLRQRGFDPYAPPPIPEYERQQPWLDHYRALRTEVSHYQIQGLEPELRLCEQPDGARAWEGPDPRSIEDVRQMDLQGEGPDEGFVEWVREFEGIL